MIKKRGKRIQRLYEAKRTLCTVLMLLFSSMLVFAQTGKVTGTIKDRKGEPLPGVSVAIKGTPLGVMSGIDGKFSINLVENNAVLTFTYLGFAEEEKAVKSGDKLDIVLQETTVDLNQVVVVGYGTQKRGDVTAAIASIDARAIEERQPVTVLEALQGTMPGVRVTSDSGAPGEDEEVIIRGISTLSDEGVKPLYIVDGVPMSNLNSVNPKDVESIDILKDGASAAIYGSRSANGVVIVTTKAGQEGKPEISLDYLQTFSTLANRVPQANRREREIYDSRSRIGLELKPDDSTAFVRNADNDYQDLITRTAIRNQVNFSMRGGTKQLKYYNNIRYLKDEGIVLNTYSNRISARTNVDYSPSQKFTLNTRLSFSYQESNYLDEANVLRQALQRPPEYALYFPDGSFMYANNGRRNPIAEALLREDARKNYKAVLYQSVNYYITKPLMFHADISTDIGLDRRSTFVSKLLSISTTNPLNSGLDNTSIPVRTMANAYFRYSKTVNKAHRVNVTAGLNAEKNSGEEINLSGRNFVTEAVHTLNAAGEFILNNLYTTGTNSSLLGFYGRAEYSYKSRYMFNAIIRRDGSSVFGSENRWGSFPSFSAGWRVSQESFMKWAKPVLYDAKLRGSWGVTGNQAIGDFDALQQFTFGSYFYNGVSGVRANTRLGNDMLKWEETSQSNIGLDLSFLKGRISFVGDYYVKNTKDLLYNMRLPLEIGYSSGARTNLGSIQNKGIELMVTANIIQNKKMKWETSVNWSRNRNKITHLPDGDYITNMWYVGQGLEAGNFYGYKHLGIYQYDESNAYTEDYKTRLIPQFQRDEDGNVIISRNMRPFLTGYTYPDGTPYAGTVYKMTTNGVVSLGGDIIWENLPDANGNLDGNIGTEDRQIIGYGQPRWSMGWSNSFSYKQFSLSVNLYGNFGNSIFNEAARFRASFSNGATTPEPYFIYNMWKYPGQITDTYRGGNTAADNMRTGSTFFLEDGSFIRLQSVRFGYQLPNKWSKKMYMKNLNCYAYGNNLLRWTNYTGFDPEVAQRSVLTPGNDTGRYPRRKAIGLGIQASF